MITSGLGLSWVMVPLGPWSLKGLVGSGWELVTPCARSAVADICAHGMSLDTFKRFARKTSICQESCFCVLCAHWKANDDPGVFWYQLLIEIV